MLTGEMSILSPDLQGQAIAAAMASLTACMMSVVLLPKVVTAVTMTRKTSEAIRPYSMAVAPDSSRQKRLR